MYLAVGRLQFSVTVEHSRTRLADERAQDADLALEDTSRKDLLHRQVEDDRARWADAASERGGWMR